MHFNSVVSRVPLLAFLALGAALPTPAPAISILSGPSFTPSAKAPLAGRLRLTTDAASRLRIAVTAGTDHWERNFFDYETNHSVPLLGFKPDRTNQVTVTAIDRYRHETTAGTPIIFRTGPLPGNFPKINLLKSDPEKMEPGYTLFRILVGSPTYTAMVDNGGDVVWYANLPSTADMRQLDNGNLLTPLSTNFVEYNMLGETVRELAAPEGLPIDQHDAVPTDHGTILYISYEHHIVDHYPSSATNPDAPLQTTNVLYNQVVEISATDGALLHTWSLYDMLDPRRIDYLAFQIGLDPQHGNAVIEDPRDDSLIVSLRHQDAVIKFSRSGQLKWILGTHANWAAPWQPFLLTPVGSPFEWSYAQHAPLITPQGTLLLFDDGNYRASPFDAYVGDANNYSRAVEYDINEQTMEVTQVWDAGRTNTDVRLFAHALGNADWLPKTGNVLINYGNITYVDGLRPGPSGGSAVRIRELTHEPIPQVVFDLELYDRSKTNSVNTGYWVYRSHRVPDLYPHPADPVTDLTMTYEDGTPVLQFSADETRTYTVETSKDLQTWRDAGDATPEAESGEFSFVDDQADGLSTRYYRVMTE